MTTTRRAVARVCVGVSALCLIFAVLLAGRGDWGPALGIAATGCVSVTGGLVYLRSTGRRS
jgi:hypothetical protein